MKSLSRVFLALLFFTPLYATGGEGQQVVAPQAKHPKYYRPAGAKALPRQLSSDVAIVNSASFLLGVSPGGLATIFGHNLTDISGTVIAGTNPLPTSLSDVSVTVNGIYAPIYAMAYANGEDQISVQIPYGTDTGPGAVVVKVFDYGNLTGSVQADSYDEDPGIFMYQGNYALAQRFPDYSLVGPGNPAARGDILILYVTGLGPLSINLRDGYGAPSSPAATTTDPFQVVVAGENCRVFFSGLAPGFVGLYQINLQLPGDLPAGDLDIQILSQFANSQTATLPVR